MNDAREQRALIVSVAAVWLATAVLVVHPAYRAIGAEYLGRLGLPAWLMPIACAGELGLGLYVAFAPPDRWLAAVQTAAVVGFTAILATVDPMLLVHPVGVLTKNLPLLAVLWTATLVAREGWTPRVRWILRGGLALIWITEGLLPKVVFQQPWELAIVSGSGLVAGDPGTFLVWMGLAQAASGVAALLVPWRGLRWLLLAQAAALIALPLLVSWQDPLLWVHPFGPLTKNVPIVVGTLVLARRCSTWS